MAGDDFNGATADNLGSSSLAPGESTDRCDAFRKLCGREPVVEALFKWRGFTVGSRTVAAPTSATLAGARGDAGRNAGSGGAIPNRRVPWSSPG